MIQHAILRLTASGAAIAELARGITLEQARWKPAPDQWSLLEVLCHLYDEEREDFRQRLDLTLHQPDQPLPPIDPQGWVSARAYNQRDLAGVLAQFLAERQQSLAWLGALQAPNWDAPVMSPHLAGLRAGDMLAAWVAHDLLHIRQLNELRYQLVVQAFAPYSPEYAGEWEV